MTLIRISIVIVFLSLLAGLTFMFVNPNVRSFIEFQKKQMSFFYSEFVGGLNDETSVVDEQLPTPNEYAFTIPVLVYHGLIEDGSVYSMSEEMFDNQLRALYEAGYTTVTLAQLDQFLNNQTPVPKKSFMITFDDGRQDSFYVGDPIIKKYGFTAVMFIPGVILNSDSFASSYYLDKNDLKLMNLTNRWELGSHGMQLDGGFIAIDANGTKGQFLSNKMWLKTENRLETDAEYQTRVKAELTNSKILIEAKLGQPIIAFSYPFGDYGQDSKNAQGLAISTIGEAVAANYQLAFQQVRPLNGMHVGVQEIDNQYFLSRIEPKNEVNTWAAEKVLSHFRAGEIKSLPYTSAAVFPTDWKTTWGGFKFNGSTLSINATEQSEGAFSFIDGTFTWRDYIFATDIKWDAGSHVLLVARIQNNSNYVQCSFNEDMLRIELLRDNERFILREVKQTTVMNKVQAKLAIAVQGDIIECYIDGNQVIAANVAGVIPQSGAVGVKIWDQTLGTSRITLNSFHISEYTPENLTQISEISQSNNAQISN